MANIQANVEESVFQIKNWLGVNEAPEGEARLKYGEAAKMRNFRITAGGGLQKRPGSKNVAGLMTQYNAFVDEEKTEEIYKAEGVMSAPVLAYPRLGTDSVGNAKGEGDAAEVTEANANDYAGYYIKAGGTTGQLVRVETEKADGELLFDGGAAKVGSVVQIASGTKNDYDGKETITGETQLSVFSELSCVDGVFQTGGDVTVVDAALSETVGWKSENVGGFVLYGGKIFRYYGAKTDKYGTARYRKKFKCTRNTHYSTYYTQGPFEFVSEDVDGPGAGYSGSSSYSFDRYTGTFSAAGVPVTLLAGQSGTIYQTGSGNICKQINYDGLMNSETGDFTHSICTIYYSYAKGPYTSVSYSYSVGEYVESKIIPDSDRPDTDLGYTYVGTAYADGYTHTVMKSPDNEYFAYRVDENNSDIYFLCKYSWHGEPLECFADVSRWYAHPAYSEVNGAGTEVRGIWSGYVAGREVLCAACNGYLWELSVDENGGWSKVSCGSISTDADVHMFGFNDNLYLMTGESYMVWNGTTLTDVEGYRPLVTIAAVPGGGGGTAYEQVNKLSPSRRMWFSPDGTAKEFVLPEKNIVKIDWVKDLASGLDYVSGEDFEADISNGKITFSSAPAQNVNSIEVAWTVDTDFRATVEKMRFSEFYNGTQDTRVFVYGDGSNRAFYSGLDNNGKARVDYFPDMNEVTIGDGNTPITAMIRHYNSLLTFKTDSAYSIRYDTITLADGSTTAGFYVTNVNKTTGNIAPGQAQLVENKPRTLDARSVVEWKATSSTGNITGDDRNTERVSRRVDSTIRTFDLDSAHTFYDKYAHEFYVIGTDGTALVHSIDADAWFIYTGLQATCMVVYKDELYYGTRDGYMRHFSTNYFGDEDAAIDAYWESGAMSFDKDYRRKYSAMLWIGIKPEDNGYLAVTAETDKKADFMEYNFTVEDAAQVPTMNRIKMKAKKFTYYKLILQNNTNDTTATVVSADIRVRSTGYVR